MTRTFRSFRAFREFRDPRFFATHQYADIADLLASLGDKVIAPAEAKAKKLEKR